MKAEYQPDYLVPFADMLAYEIEGQNITLKQLSNNSGLTMAHIKGLLSAECIVDKNSAKALHAVLGRSVEYWLNIEMHYQEALIRLKKRN